MPTSPSPASALQAFSPYATRLLDARPDLAAQLERLAAQPYRAAQLQDALAGPWADEAALNRALRRLKQEVWLAVASRDLGGQAPLAEVTETFSALAEAALSAALRFHTEALGARHGRPRNPDGSDMDLVTVAMGKLGGRELNVSSDIDLIFLYPEDGATAGPEPLSHHEFFAKLVPRVARTLSSPDADGYVFRVDLRLRPWGDSGPPVMSYAMLEEYLALHGRAWERYAWIKARPISGGRHAELMAIVRPFVFRKYLDFNAFAALRELHAQIRAEVARKDKANDIKLGPGGIREIEFTAQVFQLIRGGTLPQLQIRPTLGVLALLEKLTLLPAPAVAELAAAYDFLRRLEHRLQYREDAQTQRLPEVAEALEALACAMNFPTSAALLESLNLQRQRVTRHFDQVFAAPQAEQAQHPLAALWQPGAAEQRLALLAQAGYRAESALLERLDNFRSRVYERLPETSRRRLDALLPPLLEIAGQTAAPEDALLRLLDLLEAIARRSTYLALLTEYPAALRHLARLLAASPWAAQLVTRQPVLLDELIDPRELHAEPDWQAAAAELRSQLAQAGDDTEAQMDLLRRFKQVQTLHLLAQDVTGHLSVERLSDHLAALADTVLQESLPPVWAGLKGHHRPSPRFTVIAYGKLGGKELGYASDLDLVFLYDDGHADAGEIYARYAQRLNTWLTTATSAGVLYETDLRLRPDGAAGLLVSSLAAFEEYQLHHAWTWEHQALTRARFVAGDADIGARFEALRRRVLCQPRDMGKLRSEVLAMREKMRAGHPNRSGLFDLKHDPGGLVDVEFAVQYLVLAHACGHAELLDNVGNIALLKRAGQLVLLAPDIADAAADAYRNLRRLQHAAKLRGDRYARVDGGETAALQAAVIRLWDQVFAIPEP